MANPIISAVIPSQSFRVYNDRDGRQVWRPLAILKVEIESSSANAQKPLSDQFPQQQTITDEILKQDVKASKIIRPSRMSVTGIVPDLSTVEGIIAMWQKREATVSLISRGVLASNMAVVNVEFEQGPEMLSAQKVLIELEQALAPSFNKYAPEQSADQSTYGIRIQTPQSFKDSVTDTYNRVKSFFGNLV